MERKRKVTIYDVAEKSGASASTVASILNGSWERRRIAPDTAARVNLVAETLGYSANRQASALRTSRSGLIGMIIPLHDNRYFSSISQSFEEEARRRSLCPVVVSTLRDPVEERHTVAKLISHNIDQLFIAGATAPDTLSDMCSAASIAHINIDLPGTHCASVISDNYWGAQQLTQHLLHTAQGADIVFIGGIASDFNTTERARAFRETVMAQTGIMPAHDQINICGYSPEEGEAAIRRIYARLGRLPSAILVNSTISFEGVFRFLKELPDAAFEQTALGCYDWDPFLSHLHFPVSMVRQNAKALVKQAFDLLDSGDAGKQIQMVRPDLLFT